VKITKTIIKNFEYEQQAFGTEVAISNVLWQFARQTLKDIGVTRLTTSYHNPKNRKGRASTTKRCANVKQHTKR
jgi:hypothetical protein